MLKFLSLLCLSFVCAQGQAAAALLTPDTFRLTLTLPVGARFATADNLGNLYIITTTNALEKYAPDGRLLTRYSTQRLGNALYIDVSNPLKVLVWYADFRMLVFLDRSLTLLGELNLIEAGYPEVRTVAAAMDGKIWLYDEVNFRLVKITQEGDKMVESQPLSQMLPGATTITCIRDDNNRVCASDPEQGLLEFDAYAQFQRVIGQRDIREFQLLETGFSWLEVPTLRFRPWHGPESPPIQTPSISRTGNRPVWLAGRYLLVGGAQQLECYQWQ